MVLNTYQEARAREVATYLVQNSSTCRKTAKAFNISKNTVLNDINNIIRVIDYELYLEARNVLDTNKKEAHVRGGDARRRICSAT